MTVEELREELGNYPDSLEVFITDETVGGKIDIKFVSDNIGFVADPQNHTHYVILVTNSYQGT
jgi:hypothetical protein